MAPISGIIISEIERYITQTESEILSSVLTIGGIDIDAAHFRNSRVKLLDNSGSICFAPPIALPGEHATHEGQRMHITAYFSDSGDYQFGEPLVEILAFFHENKLAELHIYKQYGSDTNIEIDPTKIFSY